VAQLRQKRAEIEAVNGAVFCVVPGDDSRAQVFKERSAGPFCTLSDPAGRTGAMYGVTKLHVGVDWASARSLFVIDRNGTVRYAVEHYMAGFGPRGLPLETVLEEVKKAGE
jgi:peroxiredoxin